MLGCVDAIPRFFAKINSRAVRSNSCAVLVLFVLPSAGRIGKPIPEYTYIDIRSVPGLGHSTIIRSKQDARSAMQEPG